MGWTGCRSLRIAVTALTALWISGCGSRLQNEVDAFEQAIRQHPGVASVDVDYTEGDIGRKDYIFVKVDLATGMTPDETATVARDVAHGLRAESFANASCDFSIVGERGHRGEPLTLFSAPIGIPPEQIVEAEARSWAEFTAVHHRGRVALQKLNGPGYVRDSTVVLDPGAPPAAVAEAFRALAAHPFPQVVTTWQVVVPDPAEPGRWNSSSSFTVRGVPSDPVVQAMEAVSGVAQLARPGDPIVLTARSGVTGLAVDADLHLAEFRHTPGNAINDRIAGSSAEYLAAAYVDRLEGSGLSYELKVRVLSNKPFLEQVRER